MVAEVTESTAAHAERVSGEVVVEPVLPQAVMEAAITKAEIPAR
jgi:hypothetical protein